MTTLAKALHLGGLFLKDESSRLGTNAFKALGVSFAVHEILKMNPETAVFCTASAGNHGQAVAKYARCHRRKAIIFVPKEISPITVARIKQYNPDIVQLESDYQGACEHALKMSLRHNWTLIQDTAWTDYEHIPTLIMTGYLTQMYELERQIDLKSIDFVFLQVGVGSWAASVVWYLHYYYKDNMPKVVLVEPKQSCGMFTSFQSNGLKRPNGSFRTIMSGLNCGIPSTIAFDILKNITTAVLKIDDAAAESCMKILEQANVNSGPSGAAGLSALISLMTNDDSLHFRKSLGINENSKILVFNTEGASKNEQ